jgi:transposase
VLSFPKTKRVFVAAEPCDMRKQFDGLAALARDGLGGDPRSGDLFVFRNRRSDMLKMLFHDTQGLCLLAKRLDRGQFSWLDAKGAARLEISPSQLAQLLSGVRVSAQKASEAA